MGMNRLTRLNSTLYLTGKFRSVCGWASSTREIRLGLLNALLVSKMAISVILKPWVMAFLSYVSFSGRDRGFIAKLRV